MLPPTIQFQQEIASFIDECFSTSSDNLVKSKMAQYLTLELKGQVLRNRKEGKVLGVTLLVEVRTNNPQQILVFRQEEFWNNREECNNTFDRSNKDFNFLVDRLHHYIHQHQYFGKVNTIW